MEHLDAKCSHPPADDSNDDDAYSSQLGLSRLAANVVYVPTSTEMPFGETADRICPPTTQSIRQYPII